MNKKKIAVTIATLTLITVAGVGLSTQTASADDTSTTRNGMIERFAQRFNISDSDIEVFREEMRAEKQARHEEHLAKAVAAGTITETQKQALQQKHEEMRANREDMSDATPDEKRATREAHRSEMETWADSQGIDLETLHSGMDEGKMGHGRGHGKSMK